MSRRLALTVALIAVAAFAVVYFWPKPAGAGPAVSVTGRLHLGDAAVGLDARIGDRRPWVGGVGPRHRWHRRHDSYRGRRPVVVLPYASVPGRVTVPEPVAAPPPSAPAPVVGPPPSPDPLDPRGHSRTVAARGAGQPPREWVLGDVLPADLPHVTLDPAAYGLPQPPRGQIYARVDGDVLRIDADTRRIVAVVAR